MDTQREESDYGYETCSPFEWAMYEFATIIYDYKVHPEAAKRVELIFKQLVEKS